MLKFRRSGLGLKRRVCAVAAAMTLSAFTFVAPMFFLCHGGDGHTEVESVMSLCCRPVPTGPSGPNRVPEALGAAADGCPGSCSDTPLAASVDIPSPRRVAPSLDIDGTAVAAALVFRPGLEFAGEIAAQGPAVSFAGLGIVIVLRI